MIFRAFHISVGLTFVISSLDTVIAEDRRLKTRAKPRENGLLNARDYVDNTDVKLDGRIVGGKEAERGEYPYYTFLGNCGGSLIAPSVVLTAAHCHTYIGKNVTVGAEERGKVTGRAVSRLVIDQYLHPEFNHDSYENDYSLLKLDKEVKMDDTDITLTLNFDNDTPKEDQDVTVLGLGVTKHKGRPSKHIKDVELKAVSQEKCAKPYSKMSINDEVQFCAGYEEGGKDACQGDSGGPLIIKDGTKHVQIGIVSAGSGCARGDRPGIYSRVSGRKEWIKNMVCNQWQLPSPFCITDEDETIDGRNFDDTVAMKARSAHTTPRGGLTNQHGGKWFRIKPINQDRCITFDKRGIIVQSCKVDSPDQLWTQFEFDHRIRSRINPNKCIFQDDSATLVLLDCVSDYFPGAFEAYDDDTIRDRGNAKKCWVIQTRAFQSENIDMVVLATCSLYEEPPEDSKWKTSPNHNVKSGGGVV